MKYQIPRNVKSGLSFGGLEFKGWLLFLPTIIVFGGAAMLLIPKLEVKVVAILLIVGTAYLMFQVNENTGTMNYTDLTDILAWFRNKKEIEPVWDDEFDRQYTILMKVKGIDSKSLAGYRIYLDELKGVENEREDTLNL